MAENDSFIQVSWTIAKKKNQKTMKKDYIMCIVKKDYKNRLSLEVHPLPTGSFDRPLITLVLLWINIFICKKQREKVKVTVKHTRADAKKKRNSKNRKNSETNMDRKSMIHIFADVVSFVFSFLFLLLLFLFWFLCFWYNLNW